MNLATSIIICNYNYENYIAEAVESALNQSLQPLEVIVVDDGSTDSSVRRLERFEENSRFRLLRKANGGQVSAYNVGFSLARGDIVIFLDSDDLLSPDAVSKITEAFHDASIVKVHWRMPLIDSKGRATGGITPSALDSGDQRHRLLDHGILYNSAPGSGNAYRRSALEKLFPLPEDSHDRHGADFFTIYGISLLGRVSIIDRSLSAYRLHTAKNGNGNGFSFGNTGKDPNEHLRSLQRTSRFQRWIEQRLQLSFAQPRFVDFSRLKYEYILTVLSKPWGWERLHAAKHLFARFRSGVLSRQDFDWSKRAALYFWAALIPVLPDGCAGTLAAWGSNPEARPRLLHRK